MTTAADRLAEWHTATTAGREASMHDGFVTEVRECGARFCYAYGAGGQLVSIIEPDGTHWAYSYGADGRLLGVRKDGEVDADYRYDAAGRLVTVRRGGRVTMHSYDDAGRLVRTLRGGAGASAYRYSDDGRVALARSDHEETSFEYDAAGRVVAIEQSVDGVPLRARFHFDEAGRLARTAFPAWGVSVHYEWDGRGRPHRVAWSSCASAAGRSHGADSRSVFATFGHEDLPEGRVAWRVTGDGVRERTRHDEQDGRIVHQLLCRGDEELSRRSYEYGAGLRLVGEGTRAYGYDSLGRLTAVDDGDQHWRFTFDAQDNLVEEIGSAVPRAVLTEHAQGRVRHVVGDGTETVYQYDDAGDLVSLLVDGERVARFEYDHKGRLLMKRTRAGTERYLYAADDGLLAVADDAGRPRTIFVRLPSGLVGLIDFARVATGEPVFLHDDGRGNLVYAGDTIGRLEGPFAADPFGLPLRTPSLVPYFHRWRAYHADVGLYRIGCRWYSPALRRFLTPDSYTGAPDDARLVNPFINGASQRAVRAQVLGEWLKQPRVRNRVAYCANDPINRYDPNGHWSFGSVILSVLGAIWTLPNTLFGLAVEVTCLIGEVIRWLVYLVSGGSVSWQTPGIDVAASERLNAFALVFTGGWLGSFDSLLGITFGNVFFVNKDWKNTQLFQSLPDPVSPPAYSGTVAIPKDDVLYEHELRHVNQYAWFGPFFHLGLPAFGVYEWDVIFNGYQQSWLERNAREHSGF